MSPNFIYIPADGDRKAFWLNLSLVSKINEYPEGRLTLYGVAAVPIDLEGRQAAVLRLHLTGRAMSHRPGGISDNEYFDHHTAPREPQLPNLPDPIILPPAVKEFEARLERRGEIA